MKVKVLPKQSINFGHILIITQTLSNSISVEVYAFSIKVVFSGDGQIEIRDILLYFSTFFMILRDIEHRQSWPMPILHVSLQ